MAYSFKSIEDAIAALDKRIADEWAHAEPIIRELVERGEYEREQRYRERISMSCRELEHQRQYLIFQMPPYVTEKDGILYRNQVD